MDITAYFASSDPFYAGVSPVFFNGMGQYKPGQNPAYGPKLNNAHTRELKPVEQWWHQVVCIIDRVSLIRRAIVLTAANKDGGTHVDARLTPDYEKLVAPSSLGTIVREAIDVKTEEPITDGHLVALRQMGYELLNSPDLLRLANFPKD